MNALVSPYFLTLIATVTLMSPARAIQQQPPAGQLSEQDQKTLNDLAAAAGQGSLSLFTQVADKEALEKRKAELLNEVHAFAAKVAPDDQRVTQIENAITNASAFLKQQLPAASPANAPAVPPAASTTPNPQIKTPVSATPAATMQPAPTTAPLPAPPSPKGFSGQDVGTGLSIPTTPTAAQHQLQPTLTTAEREKLTTLLSQSPQTIAQAARKKGPNKKDLETQLAALRSQTSNPEDIALIERVRIKLNEAFAAEQAQKQKPPRPAKKAPKAPKGPKAQNVRSGLKPASTKEQSKGIGQEARQKLKDFILLARQEPRAIFPDERLLEPEKKKLDGKLEELRSQAKDNATDLQLIVDTQTHLERAYQTVKASMGLQEQDRKTLQKIINAHPNDIFPPEKLLLNPSEQAAALENRHKFLRDTLQGWIAQAKKASDKDLITKALDKLESAYHVAAQAIYKQVEAQPEPLKTNTVVELLVGPSVSDEAPPFEQPFEAPPLEQAPGIQKPTGTTKPTRVPTPQRPQQKSRNELLTEIQAGKKLKPVGPGKPTSAPQQQLSPEERMKQDLEKRLSQQRKAVEGEDEGEGDWSIEESDED